MQKKSIVRLTEEERETCTETVKKFKGTSPKVRRAQILLKADGDGPAGTDRRIADDFILSNQHGGEYPPGFCFRRLRADART
jgi:hypothetical protein